MNQRRIFILGLMVSVLFSALSVVYTKHQSRKLFVELQTLNSERDQMSVEWGKLQLEQSTWATRGRVERLARNKLQMTIPSPDNVVIVRP